MPRTSEVTFSIPGWLSVTFEPNEAEERAAWSLYVELATRIASQPFNRETGSMRNALNSLYSLFDFTRQTLRDAGPDVAHGPDSFGPIAIRFLTEVLAPFTTKWHESLRLHEQARPAEQSEFDHERDWEKFDEMLDDLEALQGQVSAYIDALGALSRVR